MERRFHLRGPVPRADVPAFNGYARFDLSALPPLDPGVYVNGGESRRYVTADVTALVDEWLSGALPNHGIALVADDGVDAVFDSKENAATSRPMELEVVLTSVGPRGPQGDPGPQGEPGAPGPQGSPGPPGR